MRSLIIAVSRKHYSTPLIHNKYTYLRQDDSKVKEQKKKKPYSKPSYENMYSCLPLINYDK